MADIYQLPASPRARIAYSDLREQLSAVMACELVALLEALPPRSRMTALRQTIGFAKLSADDARAWLLMRDYGSLRGRRVGRWGRIDAGGAR